LIDYALPGDFSATVEMTPKVSLVYLYGVVVNNTFFYRVLIDCAL